MVSAVSVTVISFSEIVVQGGADAQRWLMKKFHWANLLTEDNEENMSPQYDLYTCLEDMCNFWGFQARTEGTKLYLMCQDDPSVQTLLTLTPANLATMAAGTTAGTVSNTPFVRKDLTGNIFASNDNDDMWMNGPNEVVLRADCNEQSTVTKFAPKSVIKELGDTWSWVGGTESLTGYFTTPTVRQFGQQSSDPSYNILTGTSSTNGGFCRRQIFASADQEKASKCEVIIMNQFSESTPCSQITIKKRINYSGGSLSLKGNLYQGAKQFETEDDSFFAFFRIGIGSTYSSAKWFKLDCDANGNIIYGWVNTPQLIAVHIKGSSLNGFSAYRIVSGDNDIDWGNFSSIPVDDNLFGWLFIDFMGCHSYNGGNTTAELAAFEVDFSRDKTYIVNNTEQHRPRILSEDLVSSFDYTALNENSIKDQQSTDLIYASDNNMKYGYGLVMEPTNEYMTGARFGSLTLEHPEQHYANRIANFWASAKRVITSDLQTNAVEQSDHITPRSHLVLGATHYRTLAISHQWRDDITTIKMIQSLIEI
jgi:hypothetical protein